MIKKMISIIAVGLLSVSVSANVQAATITVQKGDTLWGLAQANNTSVENIQKLNKLTTDLIHPGDELALAPKKQYTVKQGDTLWGVARDYQVTVSQIKSWNGLETDIIHPGTTLVIFEGTKTTVTVNSKTSAAPAPKESAPTAPTTSNPSAKEITVEATAYTATCEGCSGITSTGINLKENPDQKVISVDPSVIPLGSKVYVEGYGEAIAGDTGRAIKGNKIDVFIPSKQEAINFGVKKLKVTILD